MSPSSDGPKLTVPGRLFVVLFIAGLKVTDNLAEIARHDGARVRKLGSQNLPRHQLRRLRSLDQMRIYNIAAPHRIAKDSAPRLSHLPLRR